MVLHANSDKLLSDGTCYSSSTSISDEYLLSLFRRSLSFLDRLTVSSQSNYHPPLSFEDPFDDPNMEPLPLRTPDSVTDHVGIKSESIFHRDDYLAPLSFANLGGEEPTNEANLRQYMIDILEPVVDLVGSKRTFFNAFTNHDEGSANTKRQRTNPKEHKARFKPYQEKLWQAQFQKLVQFKNKNGHCCVPHAFPEDKVLSRWVKRQRYQYKNFQNNISTSTMTSSRIKELESIGFVWSSHAAVWQERFNELKVFKQRTGHCNVPSRFPENDALSTWVKCQRRQGKLYISGCIPSCMTRERFEALEALGFVFGVHAAVHKKLNKCS